MRLVLAVAALALTGCGNTDTAQPVNTVVRPTAPPVRDHTAVLLKAGLVSSRVVPAHILDIPKLPGGALGDYLVKGKKYQLFVVEAEDNQKAAFFLLDVKATMKNPEYIAYMGGYFGSDGARDIYVFAKGHYLAGVVGLSKIDADPVAIELASRL